jgi:hypothetical protein
MTGIGATFLAPERLGERLLVPSSLTCAPSGERVADQARLRELQQTGPGALAIIELLDENDPADHALLMRSLTFPGAIVASDAMLVAWTAPQGDSDAWPLPSAALTHPRTAGLAGSSASINDDCRSRRSATGNASYSGVTSSMDCCHKGAGAELRSGYDGLAWF